MCVCVCVCVGGWVRGAGGVWGGSAAAVRSNEFSIISPCSALGVIFRKGATLVPTGVCYMYG